eukprot:TRINITY_DN5597_c0_g1_i1.p1 TRINITY_DN5597_c0_g1~~TRINITY_DN5597_c0_g1_i1.p1  ORF type:complete len:506 (-),score=88.28 TRINITY_DN5597_c0_g1_i1:87-1604(-)
MLGNVGLALLLFLCVTTGNLQRKSEPPCGNERTVCDRSGYKDNRQVEEFLFAVHAKYPKVTRLFSIGTSLKGTKIWGIEISTTPGKPAIAKPNLKYIGNLHGDEVVGRELLLHLVDEVLSLYYSVQEGSERIRHLLQNTNLFIVPTVNPDGFDVCKRGNSKNVDLNRDFPDQHKDPLRTKYQQEVRNIIDWVSTGLQWDVNGVESLLPFRFTLSANFHGGDVVVNYPFDGSGPKAPKGITKDDELLRSLARSYASKNPAMVNSPSFKNGITNGVEWYPLYGGMQDWNYVWAGCIETTVEVSCNKWPHFSSFSEYWTENKDSLVNYWEQLLTGVWGTLTDRSTGKPIEGSIVVDNGDFKVYTQHGHYFRLLAVNKTYTITASAKGYVNQSVQVTYEGERLRIDIELRKEGRAGEDAPEPQEKGEEPQGSQEPQEPKKPQGPQEPTKEPQEPKEPQGLGPEPQKNEPSDLGIIDGQPLLAILVFVAAAVLVGFIVARRSRRRIININ